MHIQPIKYLIIFMLFCSICLGQTSNKNIYYTTWVLVYEDTTKQIITVVEPGYKTNTIYKLLEFKTEEELKEFILSRGLIKKENDNVNITN